MKKQKKDELQQYLDSQEPDMKLKMELITEFLKLVPSGDFDEVAGRLKKSIECHIKSMGMPTK